MLSLGAVFEQATINLQASLLDDTHHNMVLLACFHKL